MERKLRKLFDYQKFQSNPRLEAMLAEAEGKCAAIDDDALELVNAAGEPGLINHMMYLPPEETP